MYKPKSPTASTKAMNFSPSPQSRKRHNYTKTCQQQQNALPKQRISFVHQTQQRQERKSPLAKKGFLKNLQVDSAHMIDAYKIKQATNNNQTPKFCIRGQQPKSAGICPRSNLLAVNNFFSFGQKCQQKVKTERRIKQTSQKQASKSPKQIKKKTSNNLISTTKNKADIGIFETSTKQKKQNQSYLR